MSTSSITLPADFSSNILGVATTTFSNFAPYITLIVGILISAVVIEILISAIRHK